MRSAYNTVVRDHEEKEPHGRPLCKLDICRLILTKQVVGVWIRFNWLRIGKSDGFL
jgi:hypothetical protein